MRLALISLLMIPLALGCGQTGANLVATAEAEAAPLLAASFDCTKAGTANEKLICAHPQLADLDGRLAQAYRDALEGTAANQQKNTKAHQRTWFKLRDQLCTADPATPVQEQPTACLAHFYNVGIEALPHAGVTDSNTCETQLCLTQVEANHSVITAFGVYSTIASYVQRYEAAYGVGSTTKPQGLKIPSVIESFIDELGSVERRINANCGILNDRSQFGSMAGMQSNGCDSGSWEQHNRYLKRQLQRVPTNY